MKRSTPLLFSLLLCACRPADSYTIPHPESEDTTTLHVTNHDTIPSGPDDASGYTHCNPSSFVPTHYRLYDSAFGDLNNDKFPDAILVLRSDREQPGGFSELPRPVLLLLGQPDGSLQLAVRNDHLTYAQIEGQMFGEPYNGVEIDSGKFLLKHYGGSRFRWTADYQFEYDPDQKTWFYTKSFATMGDMLGEMNDLDSTGQCIPYSYDTLIMKKPVDIRVFNNETVDVANASE